jgi:hypothetical protein
VSDTIINAADIRIAGQIRPYNHRSHTSRRSAWRFLPAHGDLPPHIGSPDWRRCTHSSAEETIENRPGISVSRPVLHALTPTWTPVKAIVAASPVKATPKATIRTLPGKCGIPFFRGFTGCSRDAHVPCGSIGKAVCSLFGVESVFGALPD